MLETYNPKKEGDLRFEKYQHLDIIFVSGMTGWSWSAQNQQNESVSESCFLSLDQAIENCLEILSGDPEFKPSPFRPGDPALKVQQLTDYLDQWTEDHG